MGAIFGSIFLTPLLSLESQYCEWAQLILNQGLQKKRYQLQIDLLLLDSVSTLETMKDTKDKLSNNRYSDNDPKLLSFVLLGALTSYFEQYGLESPHVAGNCQPSKPWIQSIARTYTTNKIINYFAS